MPAMFNELPGADVKAILEFSVFKSIKSEVNLLALAIVLPTLPGKLKRYYHRPQTLSLFQDPFLTDEFYFIKFG